MRDLPYEERVATEADTDFLWLLISNNIRDYIAAVGVWDQAFQEQHFRGTCDPAKWQVLVIEGEAIGGYALNRHPQAFFLDDLHLLPEYQGHGIGSGVIRSLTAEAHRAGEPMLLQVLDSNPRARHFYERLGFSFLCPSPMAHYSVMIARPSGLQNSGTSEPSAATIKSR